MIPLLFCDIIKNPYFTPYKTPNKNLIFKGNTKQNNTKQKQYFFYLLLFFFFVIVMLFGFKSL